MHEFARLLEVHPQSEKDLESKAISGVLAFFKIDNEVLVGAVFPHIHGCRFCLAGNP